MPRRVTLVLVTALLAAGCGRGHPASNDGEGTIRGSVLLGPTCPVEQVSSPCPPQILADTVVEASGMNGEVRARAVSDAGGRFEMELLPGDYMLTAVTGDDPARSVKPVRVQVRAGEVIHADVLVESGIR